MGRQQCSAGIAIRFATNSSRIGTRYQLWADGHMLHEADTGLKGSDLYILEGDTVWRHVNTNRPKVNNKEEKICEATYVSNLDTTHMTEYMIYLPLYDGVMNFEVKSTARPQSQPATTHESTKTAALWHMAQASCREAAHRAQAWRQQTYCRAGSMPRLSISVSAEKEKWTR